MYFKVHAVEKSYAVIIMEYVGSRNLHRLLVELREKTLGIKCVESMF